MAVPDHRSSTKGHARPAPPITARRRVGTAATAPRHSAPRAHRAPAEGTRTRGRAPAPSRRPVVVGAAAMALALAVVVGGQQIMRDEPDRAAGPRAVLPAVQAATGPDRTPAAARAALEQLLAGRALMTTRLLGATVRDDPAMAAAAGAVLARTTADVSDVTRVWRGSSLAEQLADVLGAQTSAAVAYAEALRDGDSTAATRAQEDLARSSARLGGWLDRTTSGDVKALYPREDGAMLRAYAEAELRGDRPRARAHEQLLLLRMSREGGTLATSIAGRTALTSFEQRQLVERWQLLFGQHAVLGGDLVRATVTDAEDASAVAAALTTNASAVETLVRDVLPPAEARTFADLWQTDVDAVVAWSQAAASDDRRERSSAADRLTASGRALGAFLTQTTGGRLAAGFVAPALEKHASSLVRQGDAWSSGGADVAYGLATADYAAMAAVGARTATALGVAITGR